MRDVLCAQPARILHSHAELYATCVGVGATLYTALTMAGFGIEWRIMAPIVVVGRCKLDSSLTPDLKAPGFKISSS